MNTLTATAPRLTLSSKTAADLMTPNPVSISADASLREAVLLLHDRNFGAAPVIDSAGRPVGVISRSDLLTHDRESVAFDRPTPEYYTRHELRLAGAEPFPDAFRVETEDPTRVCDVMTGAVFSVMPDTPAAAVVEQLLALNVHRLFVVTNDGVLIGVVTTTDILRHLTA
jgi:CBS domain-containing protein